MTLDLPYPWLEDEALQANFDRIRTEWPDPASGWQAYTATVTTVTLGSGGTNVARYAKIGRTVHAAGAITLGAGGSFTGADVTIALPLASGAMPQIGTALAYDSSTGVYVGNVLAAASSGTFIVRLGDGAGAIAALGATTPFTWGSGDFLYWQITYETAV